MTTAEMRVVVTMIKRWSALLAFAIMLGSVVVPVVVWALGVSSRMNEFEKRVSILEAGVEDGRATFRLVCVMASDSLKTAAGAGCPTVYPRRTRP